MREDLRSGTAVAVRLAGGAPLRDALVVADPGDWLALDAGVREVAWHRSQLLPEWEHTAPLPADLTHLGEARLALALCHREGRIREAAVRRSARHPALLPLIVIRCADWAEPVRERAQKLLRQALDAGTAVDLAPLILRVGHRDRGTFGIELLEEVLGRAPRGRLAVLFAHPDRTVRRFAYRLAVEHRLLCPAELAHAAARDQDTVVQDLCATAALTSLRDAEGAYDKVLTPLLTARSPRTRAARGPARPASPRCGERDDPSRRSRSSATAPPWYVPAPGTWCGSTETIRRPGTESGVRHRTTPGCRPVRSSGWPSAETARTPVCCGRCSHIRRPGCEHGR
ncbi:hypothetical protein ACIGW5_31070 [Streptomyces prasinus]|uniref:hypothetical protein n=1 Tax=Streptomyces prasinus TaxID=67345 RepID=UPI00363E8433